MSGADRPPAFALDRVDFAFEDGTPGLAAVSLAIAAGESVALLGANGSGKTTLLKLLDALLYPTAGSYRAFGEAMSERALRVPAFAERFRRRVGFVFQDADTQLFSTTVREEIAFGPLHLGLPPAEIEQRVADVAAMLAIAPLLDRHPFRLSGGEKRRVALAAVLAVNPEAVLLDEPTAGLDPRSQVWLMRLLASLRTAGKTLVTATNDLELVPAIADRAIVLDERHRIAADGPVREVLADTALLLAANVIHEHSHWHGDRLHTHPLPAERAHEHRPERERPHEHE